MLTNYIFYPIFLAQILLLSKYLPQKIIHRVTTILSDYPPEDYPKLYPNKLEYYQKRLRQFSSLNLLIMIVGFVLLAALLYREYQSGAEIPKMLPFFYYMLQMVPFMLAEFFEFRHLRAMRELNTRTSRNATFKPRRLFDVVSPKLFALAGIAFVGASYIAAYLNGFNFEWGGKALSTIIILLIGNSVLMAIIFWKIFGKKLDPHQSHQSRMKQARRIAHINLYVSIAASLYIAVITLFDHLVLDDAMVFIISLFLQIIAWISIGAQLRTMSLKPEDFESYRVNAG